MYFTISLLQSSDELFVSQNFFRRVNMFKNLKTWKKQLDSITFIRDENYGLHFLKHYPKDIKTFYSFSFLSPFSFFNDFIEISKGHDTFYYKDTKGIEKKYNSNHIFVHIKLGLLQDEIEREFKSTELVKAIKWAIKIVLEDQISKVETTLKVIDQFSEI